MPHANADDDASHQARGHSRIDAYDDLRCREGQHHVHQSGLEVIADELPSRLRRETVSTLEQKAVVERQRQREEDLNGYQKEDVDGDRAGRIRLGA